MFIETPHEAKSLLGVLETNSSVVHVYYQYPDMHPSENKPLALFVNVLGKSYIVSFGHPDLIEMPSDYLNMVFKTKGTKFIFDRKKLLYHVSDIRNAVDARVCSYLDSKTDLNLNPTSQRYADVRSVPIMIILSHFKELCNSVRDIETFDSNLVSYEYDFSNALFEVERTGMYVEDFKLGSESLVNSDGMVFGQYNMLTPTGRPSNSYGNVNYVALNKKNGQRDCFKSRFGDDGLLVMVDYESYHLRLIGNFLKYDLPDTSIHEYLGRLYHGKHELNEDEYELSKKITFNLIYGGIDDDIKNNVPFMKEIANYVDVVWNEYSSNGYVNTWFYKRKIKSCFLGESPSPYKVFNYLLQAAETERNCRIIGRINEHLDSARARFILYTYDSFLFDVPREDFDLIKKMYPVITSNGEYPVRTYLGQNYGGLRQI